MVLSKRKKKKNDNTFTSTAYRHNNEVPRLNENGDVS